MKIPTFKQGDPSQFTIQICGTIFSDLFLENNPRSPFLEPKESLKNGIISIGPDNITISIKGWTKDVYKSLLVSRGFAGLMRFFILNMETFVFRAVM